MATFSINGVRNLIVANAYNTGGTAAGTVTGIKSAGTQMWVEYINATGQKVRTDAIDTGKIRYAKSIEGQKRILRKDLLTISTVTAGKNYALRVLFRAWGSGSAEDTYMKYIGPYTAESGDSAEDIVDGLIELAETNFAVEADSYFTFAREGSGASSKLVITEVAQPWVIGKKQGRPLDYTIFLQPIADSVAWGSITTRFVGTQGKGDGKVAADMEYFYLGERGDIYRNVGFPDNFDTTYLVDKTAVYDIIELAFYSTEEGTSPQASEKQLTILCKQSGTAASSHDIQRSISGAINGVKSALLTQLTNPTTVTVVGSVGTAGNATITALTPGKGYIVYKNAGLETEEILYTKADGTLSSDPDDFVALTATIGSEVTAITVLTNGVRYYLVEVTIA